MALTLQRFRVANYAGYPGGAASSLLVKYPTTRISNTAVLQPFDYQIWVSWLLAIVAVCGFGSCFIQIHSKHFVGDLELNPSLAHLCLYIVGTITAQGSYYKARRNFIRFLTATWCLAAFVFVNVYCSVLTSYLSAQYKLPEVNTLEDLAASSNHHLGTLIGTTPENDILNSKLHSMKILVRRLLSCSQCRTDDPKRIPKMVVDEHFAVYMANQVTQSVMNRDLQATGRCRMTIAKEDFPFMFTYYVVPKSSPYTEELNCESLWASSMGLIDKWTSSDRFPRRCLLQYTARGVAVERSSFPLKMHQLSVAFLVLLCGYCLGFLSFLWELASSPKRTTIPSD